MLKKLSAAVLDEKVPKGIFLFASASDTVLKADNPLGEMAKLSASYSCRGCAAHITASVEPGVDPFCPNCGTAELTASTKKVHNDTEVEGVICASCHGVNVISTKYLTANAQHLHCGLCGTSIEASTSEMEEPAEVKAAEEAPAEVEAGAEEAPAEVAAGTEEAEPVEAAGTDEPLEPVAAAHSEPDGDEAPMAEPDGDEVTAAKDEAPADDLELAAPSEEPDGDEAKEVEPDADADDLAAAPEAVEDVAQTPIESLAPVEVPVTSAEEVPMSQDMDLDNPEDLKAEDLAQVPGAEQAPAPMAAAEAEPGDEGNALMASLIKSDDTDKDLNFAVIAGSLVACKGTVSVYRLKPANAGANAGLIASPILQKAVRTEVKRVGLTAAMKAFNFTPLRANAMGKADLEKALGASKLQASRLEAARKQTQGECYAMAAVGLARGVYKDYPNTLKAALVDLLKASGMQNANRVVASVLEEHGIGYTRNLVALAERMQSMSAEMRKSHKENFLDMVDSKAITAGAEDDTASTTDLTARLKATAQRTTPVTASAVTPKARVITASSTSVQDILQARGSALGFN